jgi:hypothetical protein
MAAVNVVEGINPFLIIDSGTPVPGGTGEAEI